MSPPCGEKRSVIMCSFIFSSYSTVSHFSACQPSTSRTSSTCDTYPLERCTSSPSSSSAVWFYSGSSRPRELPSSSPWWCVNVAKSHICITVTHAPMEVWWWRVCWWWWWPVWRLCRFWLWCSSESWWTASFPRESWAGWTTSCRRARRRSSRMPRRWHLTYLKRRFLALIRGPTNRDSLCRGRSGALWVMTRTEWCKCH